MLIQPQSEEKRLDSGPIRAQFESEEQNPVIENVTEPLKGEEKRLDVEQIRENLKSHDKRVRAIAEAALQTLNAQELILVVTEEQKSRKIRKRWMIAGICAYILLILCISVFSHNSGLFSTWFSSSIGLMTAAMAFSAAHQKATQALTKFDTIESVSVLVETLEMPNQEVRKEVCQALTRLLVRLRASDSHLLNKEQRRILLQHLSAPLPRKNTEILVEMKVSALKALEQVGDETFVPVVQRLANSPAMNDQSLKIQQAAKLCLPSLEQRAEYERASHQLLRASAPDHASDAGVLLRPASDEGATPSDELLRASSSVEG